VTNTGDHNSEFLNTWGKLSSNERRWIFQTLIALQPQACVVHQDGCILAANCAFCEYLNVSIWSLIGSDLQQHILAPMLHVVLARAYDENSHPYPLIAPMGHELGLFDIEPHVLYLDGHIIRLLFVRPLAKLHRLQWLAKVGGGVATSA